MLILNLCSAHYGYQMLSCFSWLNDMVTHNSVYTFNGSFKMKTPEAQIASVEIVAFLVMLSP